jgi:FtsZ-binding cell division protein ZapB
MENLKKLVEGLDNGAEILKEAQSLIDNESEIFKEKKRELANESKNLRKERNDLRDKFTSLGIDTEKDVKEQAQSLFGKAGNPEEVSTLKQRVGELELTLKDRETTIEGFNAKQQKANTARVESALTKAFVDAGAINFGHSVNYLASKGEVFIDDNDEIAIKSGENVVSFDKGKENYINSLKESKALTFSSNQQGGSGGGGEGGTPNNEPQSLYEALQMENS